MQLARALLSSHSIGRLGTPEPVVVARRIQQRGGNQQV